ncbi:MAG TPA: tryptophan synthase subunit alpha [Thermoanaerobaculia bacterium]
MSRIASAFARAAGEGRAAFIGYLTAGDPDADATVRLAGALSRAGADVLELGVPFSDPIADGPVLQRAASRALAAGTTLESVFAIARRIRAETDLALVLFSYVNPVLRYGTDAAARAARAAGFDGVLLTDVPPEESGTVHPQLRHAGLDTILLVSPTSPAGRMADAARLSSGFLYVVSRPGTTGARDRLPDDLPQTARRARKAAGKLPVAIGFGISTPDAARAAARLADGVVVGSALVRAAEAGRGPREAERAVEHLARDLVAACRRKDRAS